MLNEMTLSYYLDHDNHGNICYEMDRDEQEFLAATMAESISTPPASEWSDLSIYDGAGSDEGDTFKYECTECRVVCAGIEDLCSHLLKEDLVHVVCPVCFKEFYGECWEDREKEKQIHLEQVSC